MSIGVFGMKRMAAIVVTLMAASVIVLAQQRGGPPPPPPPLEPGASQADVDKALLAAPANLKNQATVVKWSPDHAYTTLRKGTNSMVCYDRSGFPLQQAFSVECTMLGNLDRVKQNMTIEALGDRAKAQAAFDSAPQKQVFAGVITDDMCATKAGHAAMRMGPTDAECTIACVDAHGSFYVLYNGKTAYTLSDQKKPQEFAGRKVRVTGTLDKTKRMILVESIALAK